MNTPLQFCPELIKLTEAREVTGRSGTVHQIAGLSTLNNLVTLRNLFIQMRPKRTLEIGMAYGGSAMLLTASHREAGLSPAGQHIAIDPFQSAVWDDAGLLELERAGLRDYLDYRPTYSSIALPQLIAEGITFDLIYIDGSHLFEDVFIDFYYSTRLLNEGGVVLFDDSSDDHVKKVLKFIHSNCSFAFESFDLSSFRADKGTSLRYQAAKILGRTQLTAFRKMGASIREWNSPFINF